MARARYLLVGGFLGAGKTTAILRLARWLREQGYSVGLITNDQSFGLVDTAMLAAHGFPVEEITGGCFCCRFNSLVEASERLTEATRPDHFIAEPVGSCTDLRASVTFPLRRIYGDAFEVAPLSVLVDPVRALRILGVESGPRFSEKVLYVYGKQLEEAEIVVINKIDLLAPERRERLEAALRARFPQAEVMAISARTGAGLEAWFERILTGPAPATHAPDLDYDLYAEGEALLGWLNATVHLSATAPFDGNAFVRAVATEIAARLVGEAIQIAHLKMTLTPDEDFGDLAVLNLVRNDGVAEMSHTLKAPLAAGELIVNLRAEGDPERLRAATLAALDRSAAAVPGLRTTIEHVERFRPPRPVPTYRLASV